MDYFDFSLDCCRTQIRWLKNAIMTQRAVTYLNVILTAWQFYNVYLNPTHIFSAVVAGSVIANVLWCIAQLGLLKQDLKLEKERLARLEQHRDDENFKGMSKQLESMQDYYKRLVLANGGDLGNMTPKSASQEKEIS